MLLAINKANFESGLELLILNFAGIIEVLLNLGGDIILNDQMFGGDVNSVWVSLHKLKA